MVAGDQNDQFAAAILDFIARLDRRHAGGDVPHLSTPGM
jgi:hypothetical protein